METKLRRPKFTKVYTFLPSIVVQHNCLNRGLPRIKQMTRIEKTPLRLGSFRNIGYRIRHQ